MKDSRLNKTSDITMEACAWIAQLETGDLTPEDLAAFREWMQRSPAHQAEIKQLAQLSKELDSLTEMAVPLKEAAEAHREIVRSERRGNRWHASSIVTSVFMLALLCFSVFSVVQKNLSPVDPAVIVTKVGDTREVMLSDGTLVILNTDTELEIDYNADRRKVRLLKGEAFFQVAHNPKRPFIVYAKERSVRAIGTAFMVSLLPKKFEVTVTEGHVELANTASVNQDVVFGGAQENEGKKNKDKGKVAAQLLPKKIQLKAGESVSSRTDSAQAEVVEEISEHEITRKLSWQSGFLDFSDMPLTDVVEDLGRYTSTKIEILDPELLDLKFGGIFRMNELQALFDVLETSFDINVDRVNADLVRLSLKESEDYQIH